ncbi:MAG TPA: hypothetical protein VKY22_18820 [Bradyrhizobium sp.]|nr:hypothetical protein [Bradyrhizobium sp.]
MADKPVTPGRERIGQKFGRLDNQDMARLGIALAFPGFRRGDAPLLTARRANHFVQEASRQIRRVQLFGKK